MDEREQQIQGWAAAQLNLNGRDCHWQAVAGDASARRYFRLGQGEGSRIAMDAPPASEKNQAFLEVRALLEDGGVRVPSLEAVNLEDGFLLLEDLGDELLLGHLDALSVDRLYTQALDMLLDIQALDSAARLPAYDEAVLAEELSRFPQWFCEGLLQLDLSAGERELLENSARVMIDQISQQPRVFVHRDYHSRNLLLLPGGELACIDFQDALHGPLCYDLVSLMRDCYIRWPGPKVRQWALQYRQRLLQLGYPAGESEEQFLRWFDWTGLQRHLKVLGNFSRLALRDNKPGYLADIPLVFEYCGDVLQHYPELGELASFMRDRLQPLLGDAIAGRRS